MISVNINKMSSSNGVRLEQYTEKSIAVFGNTQPIKDKLKELGGKFNANLRGQPGWIFVLSARPRIEEYISTLPSELPVIERISPRFTDGSYVIDDIIKSLISRIDALESIVETLVQTKPKAKPKIVVASDDAGEEDEVAPKRLLRK